MWKYDGVKLRWSQQGSPKWYSTTTLCGITTQKISIWISFPAWIIHKLNNWPKNIHDFAAV